MANGLNAQYQGLYDAALPQLDLANQQANQARGMFYSGNAIDSQTKARADLLAKLLAQQATDTQQQTLQAARINQAQSAQENQTKAANRATNMGLIGSGVGAATTLAGLHFMQPGANGLQNTFMMANSPSGYGKMVNGVMTPIPVAGGAAPGAGVGGSLLNPSAGAPGVAAVGGGVNPGGPLMSDSSVNSFDGLAGKVPTSPVAAGAGIGGPGTSLTSPTVPGSAASPAGTSMWSNPGEQLGAGLVGGAGGYLAANAAGAKGTNAAIGSGLGGLLGGAFGSSGIGASWGAGNPYAAGAGALLGSFGGGLLGNLFK